MHSPVRMTHVPHERGVAAAPLCTVRAPDGPGLPSEEPAAWSSVRPTSSDREPQDSQACRPMRLLFRGVRSTGEIKEGEG